MSFCRLKPSREASKAPVNSNGLKFFYLDKTESGMSSTEINDDLSFDERPLASRSKWCLSMCFGSIKKLIKSLKIYIRKKTRKIL